MAASAALAASPPNAADSVDIRRVDIRWIDIRSLHARFAANLAVIIEHRPDLARSLGELDPAPAWIRCGGNSGGDRIEIGRTTSNGVVAAEPAVLPAAAAESVAAKLYPAGQCTQPVLVAGLDQGWLWGRLFEMPTSTPAAPGHRPPLYFCCSDLSRLWRVLHLQDWRALLADVRVRLFCGPDALDQFRRHAIKSPQLPLPRLSVTLEPTLWAANQNIDSLLREIGAAWEERFNQLRHPLNAIDATADSHPIAARLRSGEPLRILGFTSRFTTFLQYSMRDWLDAFRSLGHETCLLIESEDHETIHPLSIAAECARFRPDLIVAIDHFRAELSGLPAKVPFVMWVQDRLPNIFNPRAGAAQGPNDYVIGQGRTDCVHRFGYPSARFMPAIIGTNPGRFRADDGSAGFDCDASFISHCSTPADQLIQSEINRINAPEATRLLRAVFDHLRSIYDSGGSVTQQYAIESIIRRTLHDTQTSVPDIQPLLDLFTHRINNALYRHQAIGWVAETGVDLRLYGKGWDNNPRFARYARGVADNEKQLAGICRRSRINLQVTPFGAAHQRLFDGIAAGGFFLLRRTAGDRFDQLLRRLWRWCDARQIADDADLLARADDEARCWLTELDTIDGKPLIGRGYDFVSEMNVTAAEGFIRSAGTIWPEFGEVSFDERTELQTKVAHFLDADEQRMALAADMRGRVLQSLTYASVSQRMLRMIATLSSAMLSSAKVKVSVA